MKGEPLRGVRTHFRARLCVRVLARVRLPLEQVHWKLSLQRELHMFSSLREVANLLSPY